MLRKLFILALLPLAMVWAHDFTDEQVINYHNRTSNDQMALVPLIAGGFFDGAQKVLDVGCGDGKITAQLAKQFPEITFVGCDISKAMIAFASKTYPARDYPNLIFIEKDGSDLGYENEFDRVICLSALHWISDQKVALESFYTALKPQGRVYIQATPKSSNNDFKTISMKVILSFKWVSHFLNFKSSHSFHSERDYRKILKGVGFSIDRMEQKNEELVFQDRPALETFLKAVLSPIAHLPQNKRNSFLSDYYEELVSYGSVDDQNRVHIRFDELELELSKS